MIRGMVFCVQSMRGRLTMAVCGQLYTEDKSNYKIFSRDGILSMCLQVHWAANERRLGVPPRCQMSLVMMYLVSGGAPVKYGTNTPLHCRIRVQSY